MSPDESISPTNSGKEYSLTEIHARLVRSPPPICWPVSPRSNGTFSPDSRYAYYCIIFFQILLLYDIIALLLFNFIWNKNIILNWDFWLIKLYCGFFFHSFLSLKKTTKQNILFSVIWMLIQHLLYRQLEGIRLTTEVKVKSIYCLLAENFLNPQIFHR